MRYSLLTRLAASTLALAVPIASCTTAPPPTSEHVALLAGAIAPPDQFAMVVYDEEGQPAMLRGGDGWADVVLDAGILPIELEDFQSVQDPSIDEAGDGWTAHFGDGYWMRTVDAIEHPDGSATVFFVDSEGRTGNLTVTPDPEDTPEPGPTPTPEPGPTPAPGPVLESLDTLGGLFAATTTLTTTTAEPVGSWVELVDKLITDPKMAKRIKALLKPFGYVLRRLPYVLLAYLIGQAALCFAQGGAPTLKVSLFPPDIEIGCVFPPK